MDARRKFGEHERCVRVSEGAAERATLGSNIDDKNACFLINYKILVTRDMEKQTPLLARYKHATIV